MPEFHERFLAGEIAATLDLLAPDATFHSPAADYEGHDRIAGVFAALGQVITDGHATNVWRADRETAVAFRARIDGRAADGMLHVIQGDHGMVTDVTLLLRPLDALLAGVERMKALLARPA